MPGDGFGRSRGENGDDVVFSTAAGGLARMGVRGAAWREAKAPVEAAQEVVELHAQRVRRRSDTGRQNHGGRARRSCKSGAAAAESIGERKGGAVGGGMDRGGAEEAHRRSSWRPGAVTGPGKRRQRVAAAPSVSQKPKVEDNLWVD